MNQSYFLLLGLLMNSSKTGYQIKETIDQNSNFYWKINYNQIYPYLKKLEELQYVKSHQEPSSKGPVKNVYSITKKGMEVFSNWLSTDIQSIPSFRNEVLVRLNFGQYAYQAQNIQLINDYKKEVQTRLQKIQTLKAEIEKNWASHNNYLYWVLTMEYGLRISTVEIEWCEFTIQKLKG